MIGARLTRTDREIAGSGRVTDPATGTSRVVLVQRSTSDTNLLPNASARIEFGGGLQSRFNYSKTLSRPSFGQLNQIGRASWWERVGPDVSSWVVADT